ncbi:phage tail spike protein [Bacillus thuringiensis]
MRTPSGILHVVDFKTEQIVANIQPKDYWDDVRHWEIKNNIDTLEFKVFDNTEHAATLMQQNLVLKEVRDGRIVPYVINNEVEKDSKDRSVTVHASGAWVQISKSGIIKPQRIESKTVNEFIDIALEGMKWKRGKTEYSTFHTMTIDEFIDPLTFLKKIASLFDLEIQYRVEVVGSQIVGWYVDMVKKRGRDTGKEVTLGKDLVGVRRIEHSRDICTALVGFVRGEGDTIITVESINNGLPYIVDNDAFQRWNERGQHKFGFYTPETEEQNMTPKRLMTLMKTELAKRVNTSVTYDVEAAAIGRVFGLAHELINEGDTIRIKDTGFTPKLYLEARAIAGDESFTDPLQDKYVFGDYREITDPNEEMRKLYNRVLASLGNKANKELLEQLEKLTEEAKGTAEQAQKESKAAKDIAESTQEYMEQNLVDIIESVNPPTTGLKPNKTLWRDISNGKPGNLKIWTGIVWELVVPDTGPLQQSIKDVEKDIESTKTELNKKVQEAQNQATGQFNEVQESLQGVNRTISNIENKQGEIDKKVTKFEQDSNGFKTSIESLTKKDTEISNKLNTVESTVEGTKKTISDVQQTTSELKKTTTEIKEEAGKISEKLTSVEKKFNEQEIGVRNLISDTKYWETTQITSNSAYGVFKNNLNQIFSELAGETVTFSFDVKIITTDKTAGRVQFYGENGSPKYTFVRQIFTGITEEFQRVTYTTKITEQTNNTGQARLEFWGIDAKTTKIIIRNFKLEKGNKATGWTPAPEDQVATDEFTKKTTEIEKSVDGVKTTVSTVQKDQGTMQTTLNQVKQTTDSNSQTITTLSQTQGKQGEVIQQNTSDITQLNNQIKSKVTDTQMQEYVGGLGSTNLLFNTAFEDRVINATTGAVTSRKPSISKWSVGPNGSNFTAVPETARNHDGMNSVKLESSGQTVDRNAAFYQSLPVSPNSGDYVLSAWFYTDAVATIDNTAFVMIEFYNGSTWVTNKVVQLVPLLTNGSWKFVSVTMPSPASGVTTIRFVVVIRKNGRLWVSQPQLQQGITPSSFMENPKDYANYDQLVGEIAKKVATSDFDSKVSKMETTINQQSNSIDLKAEKTDVYTKTEANGQFGSKAMVEKHESSITLMSNEINSTVKKGDIISSINQTAEAVKISAGKIQLDGTTIAKYLEAQELKGTTIRTDNGSNYVHIQKQFIRLMESNLNRMFIGYYKRAVDSQIQPTILMHDDVDTSRFRDGTLTISQFPVKGENYYTGSFGIVKGYDADQTPHYCAKLNVDTNGDVSLNGDNYIYITGKNGVTLRSDKQLSAYTNTIRLDSVSHVDILTGGALFMKSNQNTEVNSGGHTIITSGKGISQYAKNGSYWVEVANGATFTVSNPSNAFWVDSAGGITLKGGSKSVWMDSQSAIVFNLKGKNMLDIVATPNAETDLRFQTVTLRNGNIDGYTTLQVKNGSGSAYNAVTASAFQTASKREYKTNIRDVQFSAIEKIMALQIQQYNLKTDIEDLYEKRMNRVEGDPILTINDIETHYGWIADDKNTPGCFVTKERNAAELYSSLAIQIKAFQEEKQAKDAEIQELKEENKQMNSRIEVLEQLLLQNLIDKKPEQP